MIPDNKLKISFQEMSSRGVKVIATQSATTFARAMEQVERLKVNSKLISNEKKNRAHI